jgi:ABC-type sugar transport system ATPase subunit
MIAGLEKPSGGSIVLNGTDLATVKPKERDVTYISGSKERGFVELFSPFARKRAGGADEQYRFDEAMAAAKKAVLLDDPFTHMDVNQREDAFAEIRRLGKMKGRVVIFATSDFEQVQLLADEVAFISAGEIIQTGTPQDFYDEPLTVEVAKMTGENNLIEARRLTSANDDLPEFHTIDGGHRIFAENADRSKLAPLNQNTTLAIRPEYITMSPTTSVAEDNLLKAVVKSVRPRGSTSLVEFDAGGLTLKTVVLKRPAWSPGQEFMLGLPPHRIRILKVRGSG